MKSRSMYLIAACWMACAALAPRAVYADGHATEPDRWRVGAFTEPVAFALSGYSAGVELRPRPASRLALALQVYAAELPDVFLPERNDGFHVKINNAIEFSTNAFLSPGGAGWFVGGAVATFDTRYTHDMEPSTATDIRSWELHAQGGYRWIPSRRIGLFIQPWAYIGTVVASSSPDKDKIDVGSHQFDDIPLRFNVSFHIGYEL